MGKKHLAGGDLGDLGRGYDDVNLFGLNEWGEPVGLSAIYGALTGVGVGTLGSIAARSFGSAGMKSMGNSELVGLAAGIAAGGIMAVFPNTRHAGMVAMAAAVANNGLRAIEGYFSGSLGMVQIDQRRGFGGLGMIQAQSLNAPQLMGPRAAGGPPRTSALAARYGTAVGR